MLVTAGAFFAVVVVVVVDMKGQRLNPLDPEKQDRHLFTENPFGDRNKAVYPGRPWLCGLSEVPGLLIRGLLDALRLRILRPDLVTGFQRGDDRSI